MWGTIVINLRYEHDTVIIAESEEQLSVSLDLCGGEKPTFTYIMRVLKLQMSYVIV